MMADNNDDNDNKMEQTVLDLLAKSLKTIIAGAIDVNMEGKDALRFEVAKGQERINIDFIHLMLSS